MTEAVAVRTRFGLRADEAWIRQVAMDPAAQIGITEFGIPLMPDEFADLQSRRWDNDLLVHVRDYGLLFPDDFAGAYINLKGSGVVIEFKARVDRHRAALSNLVADPTLVEVRKVEWSLKELNGFIERVETDRAWFDSIGVRLLQVDHRVTENFVHADFMGPSEDAARVIQAHFGNPTWLKAEWNPPPWAGPRADLVIEVRNAEGRPVPNVQCDVVPEDPRVANEFVDSFFGTGSAGVCEIKNVPVVAYRISLHRFVNNDHYDPESLKDFRVLLSPDGTVARVVVP